MRMVIVALLLAGCTHRPPQPHAATVLPVITLSQPKFPIQTKERFILRPQLYSIVDGPVPHIGQTSGPLLADILSAGGPQIEPLQTDVTIPDYTKETLVGLPCAGRCLPYLLTLLQDSSSENGAAAPSAPAKPKLKQKIYPFSCNVVWAAVKRLALDQAASEAIPRDEWHLSYCELSGSHRSASPDPRRGRRQLSQACVFSISGATDRLPIVRSLERERVIHS